MVETTFLNLVNYASLMTTYATVYRQLAGPDVKLIEFGLRRAQVARTLVWR
jgi:nicotinate phosphoribosyltransferase